jgi:hypothetical protein
MMISKPVSIDDEVALSKTFRPKFEFICNYFETATTRVLTGAVTCLIEVICDLTQLHQETVP